jgi:hypothetical protein
MLSPPTSFIQHLPVSTPSILPTTPVIVQEPKELLVDVVKRVMDRHNQTQVQQGNLPVSTPNRHASIPSSVSSNQYVSPTKASTINFMSPMQDIDDDGGDDSSSSSSSSSSSDSD